MEKRQYMYVYYKFFVKRSFLIIRLIALIYFQKYNCLAAAYGTHSSILQISKPTFNPQRSNCS